MIDGAGLRVALQRGARAGAVLLVTALGSLCSPGCSADPEQGYSFQSLHRPDVETVHVEMFQRGRPVFRRELEMRLTESVAKHIQLLTPYRLAEKQQADTTLTGEIVSVSQRVLSRNPNTGLPRELEMTFLVAFRWQDLRTGEVLKDVARLPVSGSYIPPEPMGEDFFQGSADVVDRLGRRIVEQLEADW